MKPKLLNTSFSLMFIFLLCITFAFGQGENINLQAGNYNLDPYPSFDSKGTVLGTYTIRTTKSAHTFTAEQFTINIAFPAGAVYAGGANLPAGFGILEGQDGSSAVVVGITGDWSGTGPGAIRTIVIPIRIVGPSNDQPTATVLQWLDPFVTENPVANSTGSPLNVKDNPLPVLLTTFSVRKENTTALLSWATTLETNSDHFEIERGQNGKTWNKIGTVASHGESTTSKTYSFSDAAPAFGMNYYRLKMVDRDATFAYSSLRSLQMGEGSEQVSTYPNPATDVVFLKNINIEDIKEVSIVNMNGIIQYRSFSVSALGINVKNLSNGIYLVNIRRTDSSVSAHKLLITR